MDDIPILVCARATDPKVVQGSIFTEHCALCKERVMIAPSGQRLLRAMPTARIVCGPCALEALTAEDFIGLAGTPEEIAAEVKGAQPNFWRKRN